MRRQLPIIIQSEAGECGLACLAMIAHHHGLEIDLPSLRRRFNPSLHGMRLTRLIEISGVLGFTARPLRADIDYLKEVQTPCVLHWNLNHFVVLKQITRKGAEIHDPARGKYVLAINELSMRFTGIVVELVPNHEFEPKKVCQRVGWKALTGKVTGLVPAAIQIFGLALAVEVLTLCIPFQLQWVIDKALPSFDQHLLVILSIGFLIVISLQTSLVIVRAYLLGWLGAELSSKWTNNLFGYLLKLPLKFFEKRHIGDVVSRFQSISVVQTTLTGSFAEALLDGLTGCCALILICIYSAKMALVVVTFFFAYAALRAFFYSKLRYLNEEMLAFGARQQSELLESVRGVRTIKLSNKQGVRQARLAVATDEWANRLMRSQRLSLILNAVGQGIFGVQRIMLIAFGAEMVMTEGISAGMLIAVVAYADQFSTRANALIDKMVDFRMLGLHRDRIADIALSEKEKNVETNYSGSVPEPHIDIDHVSFRYADEDPWILQDVCMSISPGESVAIVGPSGCGKSTLAKLILGLLEPTSGEISVGGIDIKRYGLTNYRRLVGAVMQDDSLFAGTIADNISFFDESAKMEEIVRAAMLAEIHDEIMAMPLGYESLVGDMGSVLSGGQKQRLLLARAIFSKPQIMVMDEATSHLDVNLEEKINDNICSMEITRIIFAHRIETIERADRVISLAEQGNDGRIDVRDPSSGRGTARYFDRSNVV